MENAIKYEKTHKRQQKQHLLRNFDTVFQTLTNFFHSRKAEKSKSRQKRVC